MDLRKLEFYQLLNWIMVFIVSISMLFYGLGKIVQFEHITGSINLDEITGQELMWAFYGYSKTYPLIIGFFEIMGAMLLLFRRTRIFACFLLTTILFNIILQDIIYEVNQGALFSAIYYQLLIFIILSFNYKQVKQIMDSFFKSKSSKLNKQKIISMILAFSVALVLKYFEAIVF